MTESESVALPLGDAPLISTDDIIADNFEFVKGFLKKSWKIFSIFLSLVWSPEKPRGGPLGGMISFAACKLL